MNSTDLLLEIARCPNVRRCIADPLSENPCSSIVLSQSSRTLASHQVPEPWSGHITFAPVLFLSSNPSIGEDDEYPRWSASDELIVEYFTYRFGGGRKLWIKDGKYGLQQDDSYSRAIAFWAAIRQRAIEVFGRDVRPGRDYALTEVVHSKSKEESGVAEASDECVRRYLRRVLELSTGEIIVCLGKQARIALAREFDIPESVDLFGPVSIGRKKRLIAFLPHPDHRGIRRFSKVFLPGDLNRMRSYLGS